MKIESILSHYPKDFRRRPVPKAVLEEAKKRVLDSIGCYFGAQDTKAIQCIKKVYPPKKETPIEHLAWTRGAAVRALDFNDTYLSKEPCHPSDLIVPLYYGAIDSKSSGKQFLEAVVLGYEVLVRLCDAAGIRKRGWDHVTYLPIAGAVACGYLYRLNPDQTRHAVALALTGHVALRQTRVGEISDWKAACALTPPVVESSAPDWPKPASPGRMTL